MARVRVLVVTGVCNLVEVEVGDASNEYQAMVFVKLVVVAVSGMAAAYGVLLRS